MRSITDGKYISFNEAAELMPGNPCFETLMKWRDEGYKGTRLRCMRFGHRWCTTAAWVDEFFAAMNEEEK